MTLSHAAKELGQWCDAMTGIAGSSGVSYLVIVSTHTHTLLQRRDLIPSSFHHYFVIGHDDDVFIVVVAADANRTALIRCLANAT